VNLDDKGAGIVWWVLMSAPFWIALAWSIYGQFVMRGIHGGGSRCTARRINGTAD
jgi:hypothetical protein